MKGDLAPQPLRNADGRRAFSTSGVKGGSPRLMKFPCSEPYPGLTRRRSTAVCIGGKSNRVLQVLEFRYDQAVAWREEVRRMVDDGLILVTGAAGQLGSVGRTVTGLLLDRGFPVRAMVRREDERAASLRAAGAKVVVGDLLEPGDVYRVVSGCCRVYFIMSIRESRTSIASRANLWFSISRNLLMQVGI